MVSTTVLQFLVSGLLTVIYILGLLSQKTIWTTFALMIMEKNQEWLQRSFESNSVLHKIQY